MALKSPAKNGLTSTKVTKTKAPRAVRAPKAKPAETPYLWIDFPQPDEVLQSAHYSIRIASGEGQQADVSINGSDWLACRYESGFWWYDWSLLGPGPHTIEARVLTPDGEWCRTPALHCHYPG